MHHKRATDHFTALPPELLSNIADATDPYNQTTLLDLRLTCRTLRNACDDAFLEAFFARRRHLYTAYSLRVLYEISCIPRLRTHMETLHLAFPEVHYMYLEEHFRRRHKLGLRCWSAIDSGWGTECLLNDILRNDERLNVLETCSELLGAALENLKAANVIPKIVANAYETFQGPGLPPYGLNTVHRQMRNMGLLSGLLHTPTNTIAVSQTLITINSTQFPVAELDIFGDGRCIELRCEPLAFGPTGAIWTFSWSNLVKLTVAVHSSNMRADLPRWTAFQTWLASLLALRTLDIDFERPQPECVHALYGHGEDRVRMLDVANWERLALCLKHAPQLDSLTLGSGRFSKNGVLCLLASLGTRLRNLTIKQCIVVDDRTVWCDIIDWVSKHLKLERVEFANVSSGEGNLIEVDDELVETFVGIGNMSTADGMAGFIIEGTVDHVRRSLLEIAPSLSFESLRFSDMEHNESDLESEED